MRLETALRNSSSGLYSHGDAIAVVGDNVANANTTGFRRSRIEFADLVAEGEGSLPDLRQSDSGEGVLVEGVRPIYQAGTVEDTGRELDVAIEGEGFFVLGAPADPRYSRSGVFSINAEGNLVAASDGSAVLGFPAGAEQLEAANLAPLNINQLANLAKPSTQLELGGNLSASLPAAAEAEEPESSTELNRQASFTYSASVYDSLGTPTPVTLAFFKTANNSWRVEGYVDSGVVGQVGLGETGSRPVKVGEAEINFTETGALPEGEEAQLALDIPFANGAAAGAIAVDLSGLVQTAQPSYIDRVVDDGVGVAAVKTVEIDPAGRVNALLNNGGTQELGRIALADFPNRDGLERVGQANFRATDQAGAALVGAPDEGRFGSVRGAALERSNVDIQTEFVNLVVYQRGYQANSQAFSTTNRLLEQTIQLLG